MMLVDECDKYIIAVVHTVVFYTCELGTIWNLVYTVRLCLKIGSLQVTEDLWQFLMQFSGIVLYGRGFVCRKCGVWQ